MVRLLEIEDDDDSIERVNLDDYNTDNDMQATQTTTEEKGNPNHESSLPPPTVTVTVKLEDEDKEIEKWCRRIRKQKHTERCQRLLNHHQEDAR